MAPSSLNRNCCAVDQIRDAELNAHIESRSAAIRRVTQTSKNYILDTYIAQGSHFCPFFYVELLNALDPSWIKLYDTDGSILVAVAFVE